MDFILVGMFRILPSRRPVVKRSSNRSPSCLMIGGSRSAPFLLVKFPTNSSLKILDDFGVPVGRRKIWVLTKLGMICADCKLTVWARLMAVAWLTAVTADAAAKDFCMKRRTSAW